MNAHQLIEDLAASGVYLRPDGDLLHLGPGPALTPDLLERVRPHKAELLEVLQGRCSTCLRHEADGVAVLRCGVCGYEHPRFQVLRALADYGSLTPTEVTNITGLGRQEVYLILGQLFDAGVLYRDESDAMTLADDN